MTQRDETDDHDDTGADDPELPDVADMDADGDVDEIDLGDPCPYCGKMIFEQSERCPHCRQYISKEESSGHPTAWIFFGAIMCLIAIVYFWLR